jgi:hypothetical protein
LDITDFLTRWKPSASSERSNSQTFLGELCDVLGVPRPDPKVGDPDRDRYVFEREAVLLHEGGRQSLGFIDLYKQGFFILEAKQGSEADSLKAGHGRRQSASWEIAMQSAFGQALKYSQTIEDPPPFIVVTDIGYCFDLYASFDGTRNYRKFPDAVHSRIYLEKLKSRPEHLETLKQIFLDPHALDPSKRTARVTREIANHIAQLAKALQESGHDPERVAKFLMRCLFTMYAEDTGLLPKGIFGDEIPKWAEKPESFDGEVNDLWRRMNVGGDLYGKGHIWQFNGGLFADPIALSLDRKQILILGLAAAADWTDVEPAIFGTLLERALDPKERHRLGAHYTPRAYVERLVRPTIEEPLRGEWDSVRASVQKLIADVDPDKNIKAVAEARRLVYAFYDRLTQIRVLDPACGSGNFLFVALDLFKRIENEVIDLLDKLGDTRAMYAPSGRTVTPEQFLGIEIKPWAKEITELVLWIGYLQWQTRTRGWTSKPQEPILRDYHNIECRDAVLAYDAVEPLLDDEGNPVTRWDGETMKKHPVTGEDVPDETARTPVYRYMNPRKAEWPEAEFIVGNPPFVGNFRMREVLGDGYVEALRNTYRQVPETADYVLYWWHKSAERVRAGSAIRFGLITTNSFGQSFARKVAEAAMRGEPRLSIIYAIPDHPWVDTVGGADVRIAMTVGSLGSLEGMIGTVISEIKSTEDDPQVTLAWARGRVHANLTIGADTTAPLPLSSNDRLCSPGMKLHGSGFIVNSEEARQLTAASASAAAVILKYRNGKDLADRPRDVYVIDLFGWAIEDVRDDLPEVYQWILERVKPQRDTNNRAVYRERWWVFGEPRSELRKSLLGLTRYIATPETAKHRFFVFAPLQIVPDNTLICFALDDASNLGVLSSRIHLVWSLAAGGRLGVGNDPRYNKTRCFDPFPFPERNEDAVYLIRELGEQLDAHRKRQQELHPDLTITGMYNVLEKLRTGEALTKKDKLIHEHGLVSVLKQIHDDLDAAVFDAYGWPHDLTDEQILERLVALNAERAEEEKHGIIRWLRPEFQNPSGTGAAIAQQSSLPSPLPAEKGPAAKPAERKPWPEELPQQVAAVRDLITNAGPLTTSAATKSFTGAKKKDVERVLDSLAALGLCISVKSPDGDFWR